MGIAFLRFASSRGVIRCPPITPFRSTLVDVIEYRGWKNNLRLTNGDVELIVTLDVGPRVIAYRLPGGFNVLKNYDSMMGGTGEPEWQIRGGHRFWLAPEDLTRTYFADNRPVKWEQDRRPRRALRPAAGDRVRRPEGDGTATRPARLARRCEAHGDQHRTQADRTRPVGPDGDGAGRDGDHPVAPEVQSPRPPQQREVAGRLRAESGTDPLAVLRLRRHALDVRQPLRLPAPGRQQGADEDRPRAPHGLGRLPQLGHAVRQAVRLPRGGGLPRSRHALPDVLERGHAGDGNGRRTGHARSRASRPNWSSRGSCSEMSRRSGPRPTWTALSCR